MASEHPDPELTEYRPVSGWALAALLLGFATPVAFIHPMLWCVPAAGVGLAAYALYRLGHAEVAMVGRKAALIGLLVSLVMAAAAPTHYATHNYWLSARAEELGARWFEAIRTGQNQRAFDMMFHPPTRHDEPPPNAPEGSPPAQAPFASFLQRPTMKKLIELGRQAHPVTTQADVMPEEFGRQVVFVWYEIGPSDPAATKPFVVELQTQRQLEPEGHERWLVLSVRSNL